ncbi:phosphoribosyltransferase-like protein [Asticcacaulis taihuensis]|uniref:PRTase-CE domain-containing protein n=1 Tax=Asticcacaulis taihuensis TaxID=260084 RepID=A0A1G4PV80_9CAUL|nr:hypothetical protein [Asticcacaulis taihuensis]SCW36192.1 hypothetical protein SAMN02927928_0690 [Asticcacaulis taihuensis]
MSRALINDRIDHFRDFGIWPRVQELNAEQWLGNFAEHELFIAERLLSHFTYFNRTMTDALLKQAIQNFLTSKWLVADFGQPPSSADLSSVRFVVSEGEDPNATDSGNLFARKLRDIIRIPEVYIRTPEKALREASAAKHFVFVDDFVGSGNQFIATIERQYSNTGKYSSFEQLLATPGYSISYCPCVATAYAQHQRIAVRFPTINLFPAHLLTSSHNCTLPSSRVWHGMSSGDLTTALSSLRAISLRAGFSEDDGGQDSWHGFHRLGLSLAFDHGIPDASLPIFFSERNGWKPLIGRA